MFKPTALICAMLLTSGCSLAFVNGPPEGMTIENSPQLTRLCTTSNILPALDVVGTVLYAASFGTTLGMTDSQVRDQYDADKTSVLALAGAMTGLLATSAHSGLRRVKECRNALLPPVEEPTPQAYLPSFGPPYTATVSWAAFEQEPAPPLPASWPEAGPARLWMSQSPSLISPYFISKHKGHVDNE